jgi:DNA-binding NtrC family response regulator
MSVKPKYSHGVAYSINKDCLEEGKNDDSNEKDGTINQDQHLEDTGLSHGNDNTISKRVMIIESEEDIGFLFKLVLEDFINRLRVDSFQNSLAALDNFRPGLYDLVLIDIVAPKINGLELYYKIKKLDDNVKVCLLTEFELGYYEENIKELPFELIAKNFFIRKPILNEDLIKKIKEILEL